MTTQQIQCIITLAEEGSFQKQQKNFLSHSLLLVSLLKYGNAAWCAVVRPLFFSNSANSYRTGLLRCSQKILSTERELENRISDINNLKPVL